MKNEAIRDLSRKRGGEEEETYQDSRPKISHYFLKKVNATDLPTQERITHTSNGGTRRKFQEVKYLNYSNPRQGP